MATKALRDCFAKAGNDSDKYAQCVQNALGDKARSKVSAGSSVYAFTNLNSKLSDCVRNAHGDHAKAQQCQENYEKDVESYRKSLRQNKH